MDAPKKDGLCCRLGVPPGVLESAGLPIPPSTCSRRRPWDDFQTRVKLLRTPRGSGPWTALTLAPVRINVAEMQRGGFVGIVRITGCVQHDVYSRDPAKNIAGWRCAGLGPHCLWCRARN